MTKPYVNKKVDNQTQAQRENDIFRCAYIDSQGNEIIITEEMIQQSCDALAGDSELDHQATKNKTPQRPDH